MDAVPQAIALPEDRPIVTTKALARGLLEGPPRTIAVAGAALGATALVARALAEQAANTQKTGRSKASARVIAVTPDVDSAQALHADIAFLLGGPEVEDDALSARVLLYLPSDMSPYADANPDRRAAMSRLGVLFHLANDLPYSVLVCPIAAFARKVVPREEMWEHAELIAVNQDLDREALLARLAMIGYVRSPLVEDPGSFAVRGSILDVWPPGAEHPYRVELLGDGVLSIKVFDPDGQRTLGTVDRCWIVPVREAVLSQPNVERARSKVLDLCDGLSYPSTKTRALVDDVVNGRAFFGADGLLPAYVELAPFTSYLPEDALVVIEDALGCVSALRDALGHAAVDEAQKASEPHFPVAALFSGEDDIVRWLGEKRAIALQRTAIAGQETEAETGEDHGEEPPERRAAPSIDVLGITPEDAPTLATTDQSDLARAIKNARIAQGKTGAIEPLVRRIALWQDSGLRVILAARAETQADRLASLLQHHDVAVEKHLGTFDPALLVGPGGGRVLVVTGTLNRGVVAPAEGLALVTEEEVFGTRAHRRASRAARSDVTKKNKAFLEDLRNLDVGDFVVHAEHGIGRYLGLSHRDVGGHVVDLIQVEYAGGDKLYLPVYRLNQIQKLSGAEGTPKLDRLGGQTFAKTKAKVAKHVRQMADELLRLYAERRAARAFAFPPPDDDYRTFEATFPFDETPDQARAISEVATDLSAPRPMDRLVCGDVGFGKTEVALRAAFRVASEGKQVAVLCPTTVLAQQHFRNFESRMSMSPLVVRAMSRFQTKADQDETLRMLREGKVDVVVGTHRLLSKDVHFKDLGLLVVDEEQRFGVAHKERIKALKTSVHVLTLSATPIPRTLQMAVSGLYDMSIITTPPVDRRAIRTIVTRYDEHVIREAVMREIGRGGQVFYVYNRVEGLYERAERLSMLVPRARLCVAHGQLSEHALEQTMLDFVDGRYDVLCATAIIESGLDIPRANTILIDRADMFGLSQLYQLRGRVGRSKERAYCYLIVPPANAMTDEARSRLEALERHTELGSGFQVASLDLELRGAGDLLGAEQSGTVASVGFELFCQMLEDAVHELSGEVVVHEVDPDMSFDADALLPEDYVSDVGVRLSLYKRLASATSEDDVSDLAAEMEDRFGPPPGEARHLVHAMRLKTELRKLRVLGCEATAKSVSLHFRSDTPLDAQSLLTMVQKKNAPYKLSPDMRLTRRTTPADDFDTGLDALDKLLSELQPALQPSKHGSTSEDIRKR